MRYLLIAILPFFIFGCTTKEPVYIKTTKMVYIPVPKQLITDDIILPEPIPRETYIKASVMEREQQNVKLIINLYSTIGKYKLKLKSLRDFQAKMENNETK